MRTIKGPAIFLAQFAGDQAPFNTLESIAIWAASLGYKGIQIPTWDARLFDLKRASESKTYCDELRGMLSRHRLEITELSTHLQGQLVAVHPAYDLAFDGFAPEPLRGNPKARQAWAVEQLLFAAKASAKLDFSEADRVPDDVFNKILWRMLKGQEEFPLVKVMAPVHSFAVNR